MIRSASEFQVQTNCASPANRASLLMYNYETIIALKKMFHKIILSGLVLLKREFELVLSLNIQ
jgi:hypothetical protein